MQMTTTRFGVIEIDNERIITFPEGLPGFEELRRFALLSPPETQPLFWLQSLDEGTVALPLIQTFEILADYAVDIVDDDLHSLGTTLLDDLMVMSVAVIPEEISAMTANLAAPILVNVKSNIGKQIVVEATEYDTRHPIFEDICRAMRGGSANAGADAQG